MFEGVWNEVLVGMCSLEAGLMLHALVARWHSRMHLQL